MRGNTAGLRGSVGGLCNGSVVLGSPRAPQETEASYMTRLVPYGPLLGVAGLAQEPRMAPEAGVSGPRPHLSVGSLLPE